MTKFYTNITNEWDFAAFQANAALRLFKFGSEDEIEYLRVQSEICKVRKDSPEYGGQNYLDMLKKLSENRKNMLNFYVLSVLGFQSMMEGLINHTISNLVVGVYEHTFVEYVYSKNEKNSVLGGIV